MSFFAKLSVFALVSTMASAQAAIDSGFSAKIFDKESNKQKLLFTYKQETESKGSSRTLINTFTDSKDKSTAAIETVEFTKSGEDEVMTKYKMDQKQLGAVGTIEVKDGKVNFTYSKDGKTKTATEDLAENFVVGSSTLPYLRKHWDRISKGYKIPVRLGVADRLETVGFEFYRDREETLNGKKVFVLKMKPSSFIIAAIVNPLYWYVSADGQDLIEIHGRSQVKIKEDGSYKDLDAVTVYEQASAAGNSK